MRTLACASLLLVACSTARETHSPTSPDPWTTIARGGPLTVAVERTLYESLDAPHFYVRVRLTNAQEAALGVDLRQAQGALYPNQWGASTTDHREVIDERRMILIPLDASTAARTLADYRDGALTRIAPGATLDYYVEFNRSGRAEVDAQAQQGPFVIVAMDGRLTVSDGSTVLRVTASDEASREVAIRTPIAWKQLPKGALVLGSSRP